MIPLVVVIFVLAALLAVAIAVTLLGIVGMDVCCAITCILCVAVALVVGMMVTEVLVRFVMDKLLKK